MDVGMLYPLLHRALAVRTVCWLVVLKERQITDRAEPNRPMVCSSFLLEDDHFHKHELSSLKRKLQPLLLRQDSFRPAALRTCLDSLGDDLQELCSVGGGVPKLCADRVRLWPLAIVLATRRTEYYK